MRNDQFFHMGGYELVPLVAIRHIRRAHHDSYTILVDSEVITLTTHGSEMAGGLSG